MGESVSANKAKRKGRGEKIDERGAPALENPVTPYMAAANWPFLWAEAPLAEGGVWGEMACFWLKAPGITGPGSEGKGAAAEAGDTARALVLGEAKARTCWITAA